jgi:hypothetical protein
MNEYRLFCPKKIIELIIIFNLNEISCGVGQDPVTQPAKEMWPNFAIHLY